MPTRRGPRYIDTPAMAAARGRTSRERAHGAAADEAVSRSRWQGRVAQQGARGLHEGVHECGRLVRLGREGPDRQGRDAELLRIRLGETAGQVAAAEHEDEAVLLHRLDQELDPLEADGAQPLHQADADLGAMPGPPIGDVAARVHRAEVPAGHVTRLQLGRCEGPSTPGPPIARGQPKRPSGRARCPGDAGAHVAEQAARTAQAQGGDARGSQLALPVAAAEPAEAVERAEHDLAVAAGRARRNSRSMLPCSRRSRRGTTGPRRRGSPRAGNRAAPTRSLPGCSRDRSSTR